MHIFSSLRKLRGFRDGFKIGIATFLGYSFQTFSLQYTTATNAGFITSFYVVLATLIAFVLYRISLRGIEVLSTLVALAGLFLLTGYEGFNWGIF